MPTFILHGDSFEYATARPAVGPEGTHSWEYGHWPRVEAQVPLAAGGSVPIYGEATRWAGEQLLVRWLDEDGHHHEAWLASDAVRKLTASEWDIIAYHSTPENLRSIRWGTRLPGFLPE